MKKIPLLVAVLILCVLPLTMSCASTDQEGVKASNAGSIVSPPSENGNDEDAEGSDEKEASSTSEDKGTATGSKTGKQVVSEKVKVKQTNTPVARGTSDGGAAPTSKDELEVDPQPRVRNPAPKEGENSPEAPKVRNVAPKGVDPGSTPGSNLDPLDAPKVEVPAADPAPEEKPPDLPEPPEVRNESPAPPKEDLPEPPKVLVPSPKEGLPEVDKSSTAG